MIAWRPCDGSTRTSCSALVARARLNHATHSPSGWKRWHVLSKLPYLAIHGIDPGPAYAAWLTGLIPTATVEVWEGLGHYPHLVDPDRFGASTRSVLGHRLTTDLTYHAVLVGVRRDEGGVRTTNFVGV